MNLEGSGGGKRSTYANESTDIVGRKEGRIDGCFLVAFCLGVNFLEATCFATLSKSCKRGLLGSSVGNLLKMEPFV